MTAFPDISGWGNTTTGSQHIADVQAILAATQQLPGAAAFTDLTISGGVVLATGPAHTIKTEGAAGTDNLDKIQVTNMNDGAIIILRPGDSNVVTVRHMQGGSGQIYLGAAGSYVMNATNAALVLQLKGTTWYELLRISGSTMSGENQERFNSSGTFTVPTGITSIFVTGVGGGGGGGGGAGSEDDPGSGSNGSNGAASTITDGISFSCSGGSGGYGAIGTQGGEDREQGGGPGQNAVADSGGWGGAACTTPQGSYGQGGHGGRGGSGGSGALDGGGGGGGGGGGFSIIRQQFSVTPLTDLTVTIGAGGSGGAGGGNGTSGSNGATGTILIEW